MRRIRYLSDNLEATVEDKVASKLVKKGTARYCRNVPEVRAMKATENSSGDGVKRSLVRPNV